MALTDPQNTLAYHNSRILCAKRDMSATPCLSVAKMLKQYKLVHGTNDEGHSNPEMQALWFYGMNHGVSLIATRRDPFEPLPAFELSFVETYHRELAPRAVRAFYYLLLICTREARHNQSLSSDKAKMSKLFGFALADFFVSIQGGEATIAKKFIDYPPPATIGKYCECLVWQFYNSKWSPGFGGKKWGAIADCLHRFVTGEYSAEMMLDTIWTLSHNNGPIFNKGEFFSMYSSCIIRILDVQRSGQVPSAIIGDKEIREYASPALRLQMVQLADYFAGEIKPYVDWLVVEALGSVHKYKAEIEQQKKTYGVSPEAAAAIAAAQKAELDAQLAKAKEKAEFAANHLQIMPGVWVKKEKRQLAA